MNVNLVMIEAKVNTLHTLYGAASVIERETEVESLLDSPHISIHD